MLHEKKPSGTQIFEWHLWTFHRNQGEDAQSVKPFAWYGYPLFFKINDNNWRFKDSEAEKLITLIES